MFRDCCIQVQAGEKLTSSKGGFSVSLLSFRSLERSGMEDEEVPASVVCLVDVNCWCVWNQTPQGPGGKCRLRWPEAFFIMFGCEGNVDSG
jgi:hypothetical protein